MLPSPVPRGLHLPYPPSAKDLLPPKPAGFRPGDLPGAITALTGSIERTSFPPQGLCNLAVRLEGTRGALLLKIARGAYRGQELEAEHQILAELATSGIPVPAPLALVRQGNLSYHLREYREGTPVRDLLRQSPARRPTLLRAMSEVLAAIHAYTRPDWTWQQWLDSCLDIARQNMRSGILDPEEFTESERPESLYRWLLEARPVPGAVCLLHGDYRPKNLLWHEDRIAAVIDWAFVDFGDPYYDLAIALEYMEDAAECDSFLASYGLKTVDRQRLQYYGKLVKFLSV